MPRAISAANGDFRGLPVDREEEREEGSSFLFAQRHDPLDDRGPPHLVERVPYVALDGDVRRVQAEVFVYVRAA